MNIRTAVTVAAFSIQLFGVSRVNAQTGAPHADGMDMDRALRTFVLANQLEVQTGVPDRPVNFEVLSWIGGDYGRLYLRAQGVQPTTIARGAEVQGDVLMGRLISPFWSVVAGVRIDTRPSADRLGFHRTASNDVIASSARVTRGMFAVGFVGLAPGWFELEPTLFVSKDGDVSTEIESSIDLLLTQRLILQPRAEINAAVQTVREFGIASGINSLEFEARLRYEIRRKFAPYVGVSWDRTTGGTAALARSNGVPLGGASLTAGVRVWR